MSTGPSAEELKVQLVSEERFLEDRINHVERNFAALATDLGAVARKTARLRDKGDRLVKTLQDFASNESGGTKDSLEGMAECLSALENCQQLKIDRLETKVVKPLLEYEYVCKKAKEELRASHSVREKEVNKQRNLDRVRIRDPANRKRISQFESELQKVKIERMRSSRALEEYIEAFEKKRTQDFKESFSEMILAQMAFHAKALELYTAAYQHLGVMSDEETVQLFLRGLHPRRQAAVEASLYPGPARGNSPVPTPTHSSHRQSSSQHATN